METPADIISPDEVAKTTLVSRKEHQTNKILAHVALRMADETERRNIYKEAFFSAAWAENEAATREIFHFLFPGSWDELSPDGKEARFKELVSLHEATSGLAAHDGSEVILNEIALAWRVLDHEGTSLKAFYYLSRSRGDSLEEHLRSDLFWGGTETDPDAILWWLENPDPTNKSTPYLLPKFLTEARAKRGGPELALRDMRNAKRIPPNDC